MDNDAILPTAKDVAVIRHEMGLSQAGFADLLGVSHRTIQNWEVLRREPDGPARVLLLIAKYQPGAIAKAYKAAGT
jgi:putative transcriptional regulator